MIKVYCDNCNREFKWVAEADGTFKRWIPCECGQSLPTQFVPEEEAHDEAKYQAIGVRVKLRTRIADHQRWAIAYLSVDDESTPDVPVGAINLDFVDGPDSKTYQAFARSMGHLLRELIETLGGESEFIRIARENPPPPFSLS